VIIGKRQGHEKRPHVWRDDGGHPDEGVQPSSSFCASSRRRRRRRRLAPARRPQWFRCCFSASIYRHVIALLLCVTASLRCDDAQEQRQPTTKKQYDVPRQDNLARQCVRANSVRELRGESRDVSFPPSFIAFCFCILEYPDTTAISGRCVSPVLKIQLQTQVQPFSAAKDFKRKGRKNFTERTSTALLSCLPLMEETSQRAWDNQGSGRNGMVCGKQRNPTALCSLIDLGKASWERLLSYGSSPGALDINFSLRGQGRRGRCRLLRTADQERMHIR
jgi:hypothetical protein